MTRTDLPAPSQCPVSRQNLDQSHARIRQAIGRPEFGLFGPDSVMWKVTSPTPVVPLMLMEAGLLEAPHPVIAFGTLDSQSATDFIPRYHRSADAFYDWFFGDLDTALKTARRIFGYHSRISGELPIDIGGLPQGRHYDANEQDVLIWVWATLIRPLKEYYEIFESPLPKSAVERYYQECKLFALLFGIDDTLLPRDWQEFIDYFDTFANSSALDLSEEFLSRSTVLSGEVVGPLSVTVPTTWVLSICASRLPTHVRRQYPRLPTARRHRMVAAATCAVASVVWPRLPRAVRTTPRIMDAYRRIGLRGPEGFLGRSIQAKLPPPYGMSYRQAGISPHGNRIRQAVGSEGSALSTA
jgi:uncharacterized protein (DUF2236 family)